MRELPRVLVLICVALLGGCSATNEPISMDTRTLVEVFADD